MFSPISITDFLKRAIKCCYHPFSIEISKRKQIADYFYQIYFLTFDIGRRSGCRYRICHDYSKLDNVGGITLNNKNSIDKIGYYYVQSIDQPRNSVTQGKNGGKIFTNMIKLGLYIGILVHQY